VTTPEPIPSTVAASTASLFTVGHSTHPIDRFVGLLQRHGIQILADVRSTPFSRFNPQFNRANLARSLELAGIRYEFLGEALGARSTDPACFENGRVSYARLAMSPAFRRGLEQLRSEMSAGRVAMMCAEREPLDCHRTILVGRELEKQGVAVTHILADGSLEENRHAIGRLIEHLGLPADDLFSNASALANAAYDAQGGRISYAPKAAKTTPAGASGKKLE
jgi:uncharacterized protein (DUF488 family)